MGPGDISLVFWLAACAVMLLWQFVTRQLAIPEPASDPLWRFHFAPLDEAVNKTSCPLPEEVNE